MSARWSVLTRGKITTKGGATELVHWQPGTAQLLPRLIGRRTRGPLFLTDRKGPGWIPPTHCQSHPRPGGRRTVAARPCRRRRARRPGRLWGYVQDATVGYGFRPLRAALWLLSLMAIGSIAFGLDHPRPLKAGEAPDFNSVFYTLDLLLPVINFGQEPAFAPDGWHQWLSYALIITGWTLATTIAAGVTRTVSRQ